MAAASSTEAESSTAAAPLMSYAGDDLATKMLDNLVTDPTVLLAAQMLGITTNHLKRKSREEFEEKDVPDDLVDMRYEHHLSRRQVLAEELNAKYDELRQEESRRLAKLAATQSTHSATTTTTTSSSSSSHQQQQQPATATGSSHRQPAAAAATGSQQQQQQQ